MFMFNYNISTPQCDQIGPSDKFIKQLLGYLEKGQFKSIICFAIFGATFEPNWDTFYSQIWSHW